MHLIKLDAFTVLKSCLAKIILKKEVEQIWPLINIKVFYPTLEETTKIKHL